MLLLVLGRSVLDVQITSGCRDVPCGGTVPHSCRPLWWNRWSRRRPVCVVLCAVHADGAFRWAAHFARGDCIRDCRSEHARPHMGTLSTASLGLVGHVVARATFMRPHVFLDLSGWRSRGCVPIRLHVANSRRLLLPRHPNGMSRKRLTPPCSGAFAAIRTQTKPAIAPAALARFWRGFVLSKADLVVFSAPTIAAYRKVAKNVAAIDFPQRSDAP
jgi:hypothetical protein